MNYEAMDAETVAGLLKGISVRQLRNYCKLGCPFDERERQRYFNWPAVLDWYVAFKSGGVPLDEPDEQDEEEPAPGRKETLTQANLRKTRAEADLKQLVLAQKRGLVIGIDDARVILDRMFGNLKSQLLGAAPLLNTRLEGEADSIAREATIRLFMETICQELATGKIVREAVSTVTADRDGDDDEEDSIDDLQASAEDIVTDAVVEFLLAIKGEAPDA